MFYAKNLPRWERALRLLGGLALVALGLLALDGWMQWLALGSAAGLVLSGMFGFCPACAMVGRRLKQE